MTESSYFGHVATAFDAALLFEACLQGYLPIVRHRVGSSERARLISSGHVFIYEQQECSIQRWTDGLRWSPSRVLDEFLIYRELDGPLPQRREKSTGPKEGSDPEPWERLLCGSLTDTYNFKSDGLVKKTVAVRLGPSTLRLISYFRAADVIGGTLQTPSADPNLSWIIPRAGIRYTVNAGVLGRPSADLFGAATPTTIHRDRQDQALNTRYEISHSLHPHSQVPCAGYYASQHELGHCNEDQHFVMSHPS